MTAPLDILTREELRKFTGTPTRRCQFEWLRQRDIPHEEDYFGFPVVLRSVAFQRLGAEPVSEPWQLDESTVN